MKNIITPISDGLVDDLKVGDKISLSGTIYCGRDAVLPKLVEAIANEKENQFSFDFKGMAIMHTAVSNAGIAPTTSSKIEIESSIIPLSHAGVKFHIGKGRLSDETVANLKKENSIFVITPPVAALLSSSIKSKKCVAFEKEGMEAFYELDVENIPGIIAIAHGETIY